MTAPPFHPPRGLSRLLYRLPIGLFRLGLGWIFGNHFLLLTHRWDSSKPKSPPIACRRKIPNVKCSTTPAAIQ